MGTKNRECIPQIRIVRTRGLACVMRFCGIPSGFSPQALIWFFGTRLKPLGRTFLKNHFFKFDIDRIKVKRKSLQASRRTDVTGPYSIFHLWIMQKCIKTNFIFWKWKATVAYKCQLIIFLPNFGEAKLTLRSPPRSLTFHLKFNWLKISLLKFYYLPSIFALKEMFSSFVDFKCSEKCPGRNEGVLAVQQTNAQITLPDTQFKWFLQSW